MILYLFEDPHSAKFKPMTLTRPVDDLRVGIMTLREKWELAVRPDAVARNIRPELAELFPNDKEASETDVLLINSRLLPGEKILSGIHALEPGNALSADSVLLAGRIKGKNTAEITEFLSGTGYDPGQLFSTISDIPIDGIDLLHTLPDLLLFNGLEIERDIHRLSCPQRGSGLKISPHALLYFENHIFLGDEVELEPGVTLIADEGPVYIGKGAKVMAGAVIRGPAAICAGATVKMGAKIYGETTIGPVCKVAGEVQNVIFHSCSNKAHDGFTGNSLFGQWCNLGADTNTSNLKNNYQTISVTDWESRQEQDTESQFLGTIMGDHSKTGINTMLNTGTVIGVCCNIFGDGFPPKFIPSFSWVSDSGVENYRFEKAVETMEIVMSRRDSILSDSYLSLMKTIHTDR